VRTGLTHAPASTRRRQISTALYAAIPPATPNTTRRPRSAPSSPDTRLLAGVVCRSVVVDVDLDGLDLDDLGPDDLADLDLLERDRQRLA
jgi:hypothetical protein